MTSKNSNKFKISSELADRLVEQSYEFYKKGEFVDAAHMSIYTLDLYPDFPPALTLLGALLYEGNGVGQDRKRAEAYFKLAADQDYSVAQWNMYSVISQKGKSKKNLDDAESYLKRAAENGFPEAQRVYGRQCLKYGNISEGIEYFKLAAANGNVKAQYQLGYEYFIGMKIQKNLKEARKYFEDALAQNFAHAGYFIGLMYCQGDGVRKSYKKTVEYWSKASELGDEKAKKHLASISPEQFKRGYKPKFPGSRNNPLSKSEMERREKQIAEILNENNSTSEHDEVMPKEVESSPLLRLVVNSDIDKQASPPVSNSSSITTNTGAMDEEPDLTARGTPRKNRKMRSRQEVGGDPRAEQNREDSKLGGRVPRELRDDWVACLEREGVTQSEALQEMLEEYLRQHSRDPELQLKYK